MGMVMGKIWRGWGWGNIYGDGVGMGTILRGWGGDGVNFFIVSFSIVNHHSTTAVVVLVVCSVFIAHQHSNADTLYWYRNSVCPSVCHAPLLYQNGLRYRHSLFSLCYPDHSSFPGTKHLCEIPMVVTALNTCACIQCIRLCWPVSGCMWEMIQDRAIVMDKEVFPSLVCHCGTRCRSLFVTNLWQWRSSAHIWRLLFRRAYLA